MCWDMQSKNNDGTVKVKHGYSYDNSIDTTEFIVTDSSDKTGHQHIVIDKNGREIHNQWHDNH